MSVLVHTAYMVHSAYTVATLPHASPGICQPAVPSLINGQVKLIPHVTVPGIFDNVGGIPIAIITNIVIDIINGFVEFLFGLLSLVISIPDQFTCGLDGIQQAWNLMRDLAMVLLVLFAMISGLQMMFGRATGIIYMPPGEFFPRLILCAVLSNLSFLICSLLIGVGNEAAMVMINFTFGFVGRAGLGGVANMAVGLATILGGIAVTAIANGPLAIALVIAMIMFIVKLVIQGGARVILINMLIILSPLGVIAWMLPQTRKWASFWFNMFITTIIEMFLQVVAFCLVLLVLTSPGSFASIFVKLVIATSGFGLVTRIPGLLSRMGGAGAAPGGGALERMMDGLVGAGVGKALGGLPFLSQNRGKDKEDNARKGEASGKGGTNKEGGGGVRAAANPEGKDGAAEGKDKKSDSQTRAGASDKKGDQGVTGEKRSTRSGDTGEKKPGTADRKGAGQQVRADKGTGTTGRNGAGQQPVRAGGGPGSVDGNGSSSQVRSGAPDAIQSDGDQSDSAGGADQVREGNGIDVDGGGSSSGGGAAPGGNGGSTGRSGGSSSGGIHVGSGSSSGGRNGIQVDGGAVRSTSNRVQGPRGVSHSGGSTSTPVAPVAPYVQRSPSSAGARSAPVPAASGGTSTPAVASAAPVSSGTATPVSAPASSTPNVGSGASSSPTSSVNTQAPTVAATNWPTRGGDGNAPTELATNWPTRGGDGNALTELATNWPTRGGDGNASTELATNWPTSNVDNDTPTIASDSAYKTELAPVDLHDQDPEEFVPTALSPVNGSDAETFVRAEAVQGSDPYRDMNAIDPYPVEGVQYPPNLYRYETPQGFIQYPEEVGPPPPPPNLGIEHYPTAIAGPQENAVMFAPPPPPPAIDPYLEGGVLSEAPAGVIQYPVPPGPLPPPAPYPAPAPKAKKGR